MFLVLEVFTTLNRINEGKYLTKPLLTRMTSLTILLLILTLTVITFSLLPNAKAETEIISITPSSGYVGTTVQLRATIDTENGQYIIRFDEVDIKRGNATVYEIDVSFNVTDTFTGDHNVTVIDVIAGESDTVTFTVLASYSLKIDVPDSPKQLQEGDPVPIFVNVTRGEFNKTLVVNITVQSPTNASYWNLINVNTSDVGSGNATVIYPEDFSVDANTNFTGEYEVFFNDTLATGFFTIGLTNSTEYHRLQLVDIKAVGYKPYENVTITISCGEEVVYPPDENVTATEEGIIHRNWPVPKNASIGIYTLNITSMSPNATIATKKEPSDIQDFTVPGFDINVTTRNLAGEPVRNVDVQAFEEGKSVDNATSNAEGLVILKLEVGNYMCEAYYKNETVGILWVNVTQEVSLDFYCNLTNLRIFVKDKAEHSIPEVKLILIQENEMFENTTDIDGIAVAHSLLPSVTYTLNASRYDDVHFNTTIISQLPTTDWFNLTVICPTLTLQVNVTDASDQPIHNATVKIKELMGGLHYEGNTVNGTVFLNCTFGKYNVEVYTNGIKMNRTTIDLFKNKSLLINCRYYGLTVYVKIVDYFGQPIPNANVTLQREGLPPRSNRTESNGVATFGSVIGGSLQITIYLNDQTQAFTGKTYSVEKSTTITMGIERYVLIAGVLVETSHLTTALIIAAALILILSIEIYRRKHLRSQKSPS